MTLVLGAVIVLVLYLLGTLGFGPLTVLFLGGLLFFLAGLAVIGFKRATVTAMAFFWFGIILLTISALLSGASMVFAHDHLASPAVNKVLMSLRSGKGPCCDNSEAKRLDDPEWGTKDGHYRVLIEGAWWSVDDDAVVHDPSPDGLTRVWPYPENDATTGSTTVWHVRCFQPGSMG